MADYAIIGGNSTCDSCHINVAEVFCACTGARIYLCSGCIVSHTTEKYRDLVHQLVRADLELIDVAAYQKRSEDFAAGKAELESNLAKIDLCCEELTATFDTAIGRLTQYRDHYVRELQAWKVTLAAEITESVNEAKRTLAQETDRFQAKYSQFLRNYRPGNLVLFKYWIDASTLENWIKSVLQLEYPVPQSSEEKQTSKKPPHSDEKQASQKPPRLQAQEQPLPLVIDQPNRPQLRQRIETRILLRIQPNQIRTFDFQSETWSTVIRLDRIVAFDEGSAYTLVSTSQVFCCGSWNYGQGAYFVDYSSGAVEDLPLLGAGRFRPGVLCHDGSVFVFGGSSKDHAELTESGKEVEMLSSRDWTRLPHMNTGRCAFTPCIFRTNAYLCAGNDTSIDVLDLQTRVFLDPIPKPRGKYSAAVAVIVENEMIIITRDCTTTIDLLNRTCNTHEHQGMNVCPGTAPVMFRKMLYWVNDKGKCLKARGNNFEEIKVIAAV